MQTNGNLARMRVFVAAALLSFYLPWPDYGRASDIEPVASIQPRLERPDADSGPTTIQVGSYTINVTSLDEQAQSFVGDFYLWFSWRDSRLAAPLTSGLRTASLNDVWHPRLLPVNLRQFTLSYPQVVEIDPSGIVSYTQRFIGGFTVPLSLHEFPFDHHGLFVEVVAPGHSPRDINFVVDSNRVGGEKKIALSGWIVGQTSIRPVIKELLNASGENLVVLPGFRVEFTSTRDWRYYVLREMMPLIFIVLMASSIFWILPSEHGMKVGISTAAIFSLMAYYVQLGRSLPKVNYLTRMDTFIIGATILVFLSFSQVILGMYLLSDSKNGSLRRLERWSRLGYPLALGLVIFLAFY